MVYTFIKYGNTAASLYILNTISFQSLQWTTINVMQKSPSSEATSCSATHSIPCLLHNTSVHYYFPHSLTQTLSPKSFSPSTFCFHKYCSLNNIAITAHMFSALQTQCWHTKMRDKKSETPTNQGIPYLMHQSQIGTNKSWWSSNLIQNYVIKFE